MSHDPELLGHVREDLGDDAEATLARVEDQARRLARGWGVKIDGWLPGATCSLVLTGWLENREVVLRAPLLPWEMEASLPALRAFAGCGGVEVLRSDERTGAALMPRLRPGTSLAEEDEDAALDACAALILRLRAAVGEAPSVAERLMPVFDAPMPRGLGLSTDCAGLARHLTETSPTHRLLHGDLHHFNVARGGEDWVALDPEGVMGDPAYECAAFIRNPIPAIGDAPDLPGVLRRRVFRYAALLGDPPERIWGWAMVRTALCVWGPSPSGPWARVAQALDALSGEFDLC